MTNQVFNLCLTRERIDPAIFLSAPPDPDCGASASFLGWVRNHHLGRPVLRIHYECYEALANKQIGRIAAEARDKYSCGTVRILHRIGTIEVGEVAVAIEATSAHRDEAFKACREAIERIKLTVPIWKHEFYSDGTSDWVLCSHPHGVAS
jgi:molybdopterin synthase catalytic subunit